MEAIIKEVLGEIDRVHGNLCGDGPDDCEHCYAIEQGKKALCKLLEPCDELAELEELFSVPPEINAVGQAHLILVAEKANDALELARLRVRAERLRLMQETGW